MNILLERAIEWFRQMGVTVSACPEHISVPRANLVAAFGGDPETIYGEVQELLGHYRQVQFRPGVQERAAMDGCSISLSWGS
jgi:hypothetical protein